MSALPGTVVMAPIRPRDSADTYPVAHANELRGGWHAVATLAERDAISADRLQAGMVAWVEADAVAYRWSGAAWAPLVTGGATSADAISVVIPGRSDLADVQAALAALFFVPLSLTLSGGSAVERGMSVAAVNLSWTASKALAAQSLIGPGAPALGSDDRATVCAGPFTANQLWTLGATAASGETASASTALSFRSRRHWGVSPAATLDDAALLALTGELATARQQTRTFDASGGRYLWFAWPADFGTPDFWIGGLRNTAWMVTARDHTNAHGHTRPYLLYRSASLQAGSAITVEVA